jgi:hypothetical protein
MDNLQYTIGNVRERQIGSFVYAKAKSGHEARDLTGASKVPLFSWLLTIPSSQCSGSLADYPSPGSSLTSTIEGSNMGKGPVCHPKDVEIGHGPGE